MAWRDRCIYIDNIILKILESWVIRLCLGCTFISFWYSSRCMNWGLIRAFVFVKWAVSSSTSIYCIMQHLMNRCCLTGTSCEDMKRFESCCRYRFCLSFSSISGTELWDPHERLLEPTLRQRGHVSPLSWSGRSLQVHTALLHSGNPYVFKIHTDCY